MPANGRRDLIRPLKVKWGLQVIIGIGKEQCIVCDEFSIVQSVFNVSLAKMDNYYGQSASIIPTL